MAYATDPLRIDIEQCDDICILHCNGRFAPGADWEYMQTKMDEIKRLPCSKMLADFQQVSSIGSTGLTFLVGIYNSVTRKQDGRFVLAGVGPLVQHVLDLTRVSTVIPLAPDLASGLAMLRAEASMGPVVLSNNASATY
jgi:anti-anti-sigma factor